MLKFNPIHIMTKKSIEKLRFLRQCQGSKVGELDKTFFLQENQTTNIRTPQSLPLDPKGSAVERKNLNSLVTKGCTFHHETETDSKDPLSFSPKTKTLEL